MLDRLYRIPLGEEQFPFQARMGPTSSAGAATSVAVAISNIQQLPFLVSTIAITLTGGAAQYATRWVALIQDRDSNNYVFLDGGEFVSTLAASTQTVGVKPYQGLLLPTRFSLAAVGTFNAGAASNSVKLEALGYYVPRGNVALP